MAIRNINLGGSKNWTSEVLTSTDLNDTFTAAKTTIDLSTKYNFIGKKELTTSSTSVIITSISSGYSTYFVEMRLSGSEDASPSTISIKLNNDSGANKYHWVNVENGGAATTTTGANSFVINSSINVSSFQYINLTIDNVSFNGYKSIDCTATRIRINNNSTQQIVTGAWKSSDSISSIEVTPSGSSFGSGSNIKVWGLKE